MQFSHAGLIPLEITTSASGLGLGLGDTDFSIFIFTIDVPHRNIYN